MMTTLIIIIFLALAFDFINGFHDAANSIATVVSTQVLTPRLAVIWAAFFNFVAFLILGLHVANTVGKGIVRTEVVDLTVIGSGLVAAIIWNLLTWWWGIPSSSSHTMVGGFVGAAMSKAGVSAIFIPEVLKIIAFIFLAPLIGIIISIIFSIMVLHIVKDFSPSRVDKYFRKLQLLSSAAYSLGHGSNDAQKMMGIIFVALISTGQLMPNDEIPLWVVLACHAAIALGTLSGGWRIVKTMGQKITKLRPFEGFSAESAGAITLFATALAGIPVSTTHTITGCIIGAGITKRLSAVRWKVTYNLVWAWVLTIPISAFIAMIVYYTVILLSK
ncbi:MAG: inorganic phosphate transporter [Ignavibacteriales bacterium]|jgi:inorganic phosphate transporter, PiT family|nr:inorganic phosphate transporter [Ignavibacteriales bacterium]MBK7980377.1 inorganic phosphate transporter [Ignavibacteriota bacterium]